MIIFNGSRRIDTDDPATLSIGVLYRNDGSPVPVYRGRDSAVEAYMEAVGPPPQPPGLMTGSLQPIMGLATAAAGRYGDGFDANIVTGYTYDPSADGWNAQQVNEYTAELTGWNNHAAVQLTILNLLLGKAN